MPFMAQPEEVLVPLLPYQRQFLAWGVSQEQSSVRGGILADEMGMGKTLQVSYLPSASRRSLGVCHGWVRCFSGAGHYFCLHQEFRP